MFKVDKRIKCYLIIFSTEIRMITPYFEYDYSSMEELATDLYNFHYDRKMLRGRINFKNYVRKLYHGINSVELLDELLVSLEDINDDLLNGKITKFDLLYKPYILRSYYPSTGILSTIPLELFIELVRCFEF